MPLLDFAYPLEPVINADVSAALDEDVATGDLTASLIPADSEADATVIARQSAVIAGTAWFEASFLTLDPGIRIEWSLGDGDRCTPGAEICRLQGKARGLLTGERSGLNFLQLLSGVATRTAEYVDLVSGTRAKIVDTRKTLPGLRMAQKYAVRCGGGGNHRLGLFDAILIKENHIAASGGIPQVLADARRIRAANANCRFIQIEVETLEQLQVALDNGAEMVLLDNFSLADLAQAVAINRDRAVLEASGGVNRETVRAIAETGVDRISIGALTKDISAIDLSMRFVAKRAE